MIIDYKALRKINPEAARTAVLQYLSSGITNISQCARAFGVQRAVIYDILRRSKTSSSLRDLGVEDLNEVEGQKTNDLKDRSKRPNKLANKTPQDVEAMIISFQKQTGFGPKRLLKILRNKRLNIPYGTLRGIIRRNKN